MKKALETMIFKIPFIKNSLSTSFDTITLYIRAEDKYAGQSKESTEFNITNTYEESQKV